MGGFYYTNAAKDNHFFCGPGFETRFLYPRAAHCGRVGRTQIPMKTRTFVLLVAGSLASAALAETITFDVAEAGQVPPGWTVGITGEGEPKWTVEREVSAPSQPAALKQSGAVPRPSYPLCVKDAPAFKDGIVEVKFKSVSGQIDQAAGVVWRWVDRDNYYVCRANALEHNVVLYKVQQGKRQSLEIVGRAGGYGVEASVAPQTWHTLRVEFVGHRAKVRLNGQHLFDVEDETFTAAGKVGLWTKADSVTLFDDFTFEGK